MQIYGKTSNNFIIIIITHVQTVPMSYEDYSNQFTFPLRSES